MGVNWDSGLIYWKDHVPSPTERYALAHLHPFIRSLELSATEKHPSRIVQLYVSFGLHTFTRAMQANDCNHELYRDNREVRSFCPERYASSLELPEIIRTIESRRCEFARSTGGLINYVTMETRTGERYAVFFDLRRFRKMGANAAHLMVQSAYILDARKPAPGRGRIGFRALLGHIMRGTKPRPAP
jgi:hypothetical protein